MKGHSVYYLNSDSSWILAKSCSQTYNFIPPITRHFLYSDLSDNRFTANLPSFNPSASVAIALLQNNYFMGGVSNLVRSSVCTSASSTVTLGSNCLPASSPSTASCGLQQQRIESICNVTCALCPNACFLVGPSAIPTCQCPSSSYVVMNTGVPGCQPLGMRGLRSDTTTQRDNEW